MGDVNEIIQTLRNLRLDVNGLNDQNAAVTLAAVSMPRPYGGLPNESYRDFIETLVNYYNASGFTQNRAIKAFPSLLRGRARETYNELPDATKNSDNFETIIRELQTALDDPFYTSLSRDLLDGVTMNSRETVREFYERLKKMVNAAYPLHTDPQLQVELKTQFIRKLPLRIRAQVKRHNPDDVKEAVAVAELEEMLLREEGTQTVNAIGQAELKGNVTLEDKVAVLTEKIRQQEFRERPEPRGTSWRPQPFRRTPISCYNCGKSGHIARECFGRNGGNRGGFRGGNREGYKEGQRERYNGIQRGGYQREQFDGRGQNSYQPQRPSRPPPRSQDARYPIFAVIDEDTNAAPRGRSTSPWHTALMLTMLCAVVGSANAIRLYDCSMSTVERAVNIPVFNGCPELNTDEIPKERRVTLYGEKSYVIAQNITICKSKTIQVCETGFFKFWSRMEAAVVQSSEIGEQECRDAIRTKKIQEMELTQINTGLPDDEHRWDAKIPSYLTTPWFGTECENRTKITIQVGQIYGVDEKTIMTTVGDVTGCSASEGICRKENELLVWNPFHISGSCHYDEMGSFTATIVGNHMMIHETSTIEEIIDEYDSGCFKSDQTMKLNSGLIAKIHPKTTLDAKAKTARRGRSPLLELSKNASSINELKECVEEIVHALESLEYQSEARDYARKQVVEEKLKELVTQFGNKIKILDTRIQHATKDIRHKVGWIASNIRYGPNNETKAWQNEWDNLRTNLTNEFELLHSQLLDFELRESQTRTYLSKVHDLEKKLYEIANTNTTVSITINSTEEVDRLKREVRELGSRVEQLSDDKRNASLDQDRTLGTQVEELSRLVEIAMRESKVRKYGENVQLRFMMACINQRRMIESVTDLMNINPTLGIRKFLKRQDVIARRIGEETFLMAECQPKDVDEKQIARNYSIGEKCYDRMPVTFGNFSVRFWTPGTSDLHRDAKEIPCNIRPATGKLKTPSWNLGGDRDPKPLSLVATRLARNASYVEPPGTPQYQPTLFDWFFDAKSTVMEKGQGLMDDLVDSVNNGTESLKTAVVDTFESTKTVISDSLNELKEIGLKILWYVLIPLLGIAFIVAIIVIYTKIWFIRKTTEGISSSIKEIGGSISPKFVRKLLNVNAVTFEDDLEQQVQIKRTVSPVVEFKTKPSAPPESPQIQCRERTLPLFTYLPIALALIAPVVSGNSLPFIPIHLNGIPVVSLVDTGASITYLRRSTLSRLRIQSFDKSRQRSAQAANGTEIRFLGAVPILVTIGDINLVHDFLVADDVNCPAPALIGVDLQKSLNKRGHRVSFDFEQEMIVIGQEAVPMLKRGEKGHSNGATFTVRARDKVELKPRSDNVEFGEIKIRCPPETELVVEGKKQKSTPFLVGRTITNPNGNQLTMRVLNPTDETILIEKGTVLGIAEVVSFADYETKVAYSIEHPAYVSDETDWEKHLPELPVANKSFQEFMNEKVVWTNCVLNEDQREQLRQLILYHREAFVGPEGEIGHYTGPIRHRMEFTKDETPVKRMYRIPLEKRMEVEKQVEELLRQGIIRESTSEFCSPVVLVKKKEANTWRFTVDYRGVNKVTKNSTFIIPHITDVVDLAAGKTIYTVADMKSAYFQVDMDEEDIEKTAFATHVGLFEFLRMPMGLMGAPGTFQRVMETMRRQMKATLLVYLDDVVVMSSSAEEHLHDLDELLGTLVANGLKVRLDKTTFATNRVKYLGFIISTEGIAVDPEKTKAIAKFPIPKNVTDIRSFLGMCNYFRRFVPHFAEIATPLTELTKKESKFEWREKQQAALQSLKDALCDAPVLRPPQLGAPFIIETDASGTAIAGVLLQTDNNDERHPIAYFSRRLNIHEKNYAAMEIEALAICASTQYFRQYILGARTTVTTDHRPLTTH